MPESFAAAVARAYARPEVSDDDAETDDDSGQCVESEFGGFVEVDDEFGVVAAVAEPVVAAVVVAAVVAVSASGSLVEVAVAAAVAVGVDAGGRCDVAPGLEWA